MHKGLILLVTAAAMVGCSTKQTSIGTTGQYAKAATFVEHKFNHQSDVVLYPSDHETALWVGNHYARSPQGKWTITEYRTIKVSRPVLKPDGNVVNEQVQETVAFKRMDAMIHFAFDSHALNEKSISELKKLPLSEADAFVIDAHTDAKGSDSYNDKLSLRRAESVKKWLVKQGIAAHSVNANPHGERQPMADNSTADGRAMNRRAIIYLKLKQDGQDVEAAAGLNDGGV